MKALFRLLIIAFSMLSGVSFADMPLRPSSPTYAYNLETTKLIPERGKAFALNKTVIMTQDITSILGEETSPYMELEHTIPSSFQGIFKRVSRKYLFFSHPYPFQLLDPVSKRRLAYIDTTQLKLPYPINEYFDKEVIVYGSTEKQQREIIIRAKNLQLK